MSADLERAVAALAVDHQLFAPRTALQLIRAARDEEHADGSSMLVRLLLGEVAEVQLLAAIASELGYDFVDLLAPGVPLEADDHLFDDVDVARCKEMSIVPMRARADRTIAVVAAAPGDLDVAAFIRRHWGDDVRTVMAPRNQIQAKLSLVSSSLSKPIVGLDDMPQVAKPVRPLPTSAVASGPRSPLIEWVDNVLETATAQRASDIHFDLNEDGTLLLRFRIDGALRRQPAPVNGREFEVIGIIMNRAGMDSANHLEAQGGQFSFEAAGRKIDVRASMLPQSNGPRLVCRLLDSNSIRTRLDDMGFSPVHLSMLRRGVAEPQGTIVVSGPTGSGKPVWVEEPVLMADGSYKRMGDLAVDDLVITHLGRARPVEAVYEQGDLDCFAITTTSGRTTHAAPDHRFLTTRGWLHVDELEVGDHLANVADPHIYATSQRTDVEFRLAGYFVGDGGATTGNRLRGAGVVPGSSDRGARGGTILNARFTNGDPAVVEDFTRCAEKMGWNVKPVSGDPNSWAVSNGVGQWLRDTGLAGKGAHDKRVPNFVFNGSRAQVAEFLAGYLDTDGTVYPWKDRPAGQIEFYSVNRDLLVDIQRLLLRVGVQSRLRPKKGRYQGDVHHSWRLTLSDRDSVAKFAQLVAPAGKRGEKMAGWSGERTAFDHPLFADRIVSIEPAGKLPCRCITVADDHSYTVSDLVTHNTTTLYALLREVAAVTRNVMTVEDPVEYTLDLVGQTSVRHAGGAKALTFAKVLREILRQDPDVILVGEVRDEETARTAMEAAITGHMVLTTTHTHSALGIYTRLSEMGVPRYMVADALSLGVAQRLARRVHGCARQGPPTPEDAMLFERAGAEVPESVMHPVGCEVCGGTGYAGRLAIVEMFRATEEMRSLVIAGAAPGDIAEAAAASGFATMLDDGMRHVYEGRTTIAEVLAKVGTAR